MRLKPEFSTTPCRCFLIILDGWKSCTMLGCIKSSSGSGIHLLILPLMEEIRLTTWDVNKSFVNHGFRLPTNGCRKLVNGTVDGSEILNNHLGCIKPCKSWDILPASIGFLQISEASPMTEVSRTHRWSIRESRCGDLYDHCRTYWERQLGWMWMDVSWWVTSFSC